ncbi:hypothetical protein [Rugamonas sp.]|uniref:hypothetical protein n=1 Tax=Rugamonas sp. TaxID=1926287 RepID=UPI0025E24A8B|nr:hypothetical protein [Rugamonas sp.]
MAVDRISPSGPSLIPPDRGRAPPQGPAPAAPGHDVDGADDFALAPLNPNQIGTVLDGLDGPGAPGDTPQPGAAAMAQAMAAEAVLANDPAAMRPNQLFLSRQLVWRSPDAALMAGSWHVMVRTYGEQRAAWLQQASGQRLPASLFMADSGGDNLREGRAPAPLVTELEPWRFAVYAWGAEQLVLRVLARDADSGSSANGQRRRSRAVLRLDLMLPGVGRVIIQMEPVGGGVVLDVGAQQNAAMQHMREMLPRLAALVARSGVTILRCRLMRELPPPSAERVYPTRAQAAALTHAIFKAMAEVAVMLAQPLPPDDVFSQSA